jgi:glycosyltransferase involved in cell wall biosynthesis
VNIVQALPFFDPATRFGGPVVQLPLICRALAQRGHRVSVVTTALGVGRDVLRERWLERDGYRVWYARVGPLGRTAPYWAPRLTRALRETLVFADLLHVHLSFTHLNVVARRCARQQGVPYVYSPRSCLDPLRLRHRRIVKSIFLRLLERRIIRDAAAVHALTEVERQQVLRQGARDERIAVIPNASPLDPDARLPDGRALRERLRIPEQAPLVLYMGRLHVLKGLDVLLEAFAIVHALRPDAHLVVAGPDEGARSGLRARASALGVAGSVHLAGTLEGSARLSALAAADVFALVSLSEGIPNAALEAAAAGTPLLLSDRCNVPQVKEYGAGRVVAPEPAAAADALADLLGRSAQRQLIGREGKRMVRECFALPQIVIRFERLYQAIVATGAPGAAAGSAVAPEAA